MKKTKLLLVILPLFMCACGGNKTNVSSTSEDELIGDNSQVFTPSSDVDSSFSEKDSSESLNPASEIQEIIGVYKGEDYNSAEVILEIKEGKALLSNAFLDVEYEFDFKERNGDYYTFITSDEVDSLEVYKFLDNNRLSVTLNNGEYQDNDMWLDDVEFIKA